MVCFEDLRHFFQMTLQRIFSPRREGNVDPIVKREGIMYCSMNTLPEVDLNGIVKKRVV